jgi:pimeloyl-ACP methyl ester carboxylesterase
MQRVIRDAARGVEIEVIEHGVRPDVVLHPSALRGAADFAKLQTALAEAGFRSFAINMRGVGASTPGDDTLTLEEVADDVALVIDQACAGPAHLVGHALGNAIVRAVASYRPERVRGVVCFPCSGHALEKQAVTDAVMRHFFRCHDRSLTPAERTESLKVAFFAPQSDASVWLDGWHPQAQAVSNAYMRADPATWKMAGEAPVLVLQPHHDAMVPIAVGQEMAAEFGARATYAELPGCGHAILPEQPTLLAEHVIRFLRRLSMS